MTDTQFDLWMIHGGRRREGLKSEEALAFILRSKLATAEDVAWLVEHRAMSDAAAKVAKERLHG